ncbi:sensor histidine kinase [Lyngbya confervoides]|uniref:histidine kinase n=1 Tax=Lyngbya confervoides BDU141951 TaxID=1574623 RepID=A0ABD4SXG0_9CYAN|nr:HAMP domain-containing sensor histidine kinase [Lyngbya confervoides]MCM1981317.1 HAMP domain-containing histidine kinase [Lyngbya confervoides BDU141951]
MNSFSLVTTPSPMASITAAPLRMDLSQKLAQLQATQEKMLALVGYDLWAPLSTLQICLESLADSDLYGEDNRGQLTELGFDSIQHLQALFQRFLSLAHHRDDALYRHSQSLQNSLQQIIQTFERRKIAPPSLPPGPEPPVPADQEEEFLKHQVNVYEHTHRNLIAIVGHELRTPLTSVEVCLETLDSFPDMAPAIRQTMLDTALQDIDRLHRLLRDCFSLTRLKQSQICPLDDVVHLPELLDLVIVGVKGRYPAPPQICLGLREVFPPLRFDGDRLMEALNRLLDNACKFTDPSGHITVEAHLRSSAGSGDLSSPTSPQLEIIVADTGRGISPQNLRAVFNSFYQEEDALQRTAGGTGIGLAICRKLAEQLGGKIWANSPGRWQGTGVHLLIPVRLA